MMAWIKVHQALRGHRKTRQLARELGIDEATAIGHLVLLWLWALDNAPDGVLTRIPNEELPVAACAKCENETFLQALVNAGFIDRKGRGGRGLYIHDWDEYGGQLSAARAKDRERKRLGRSDAREEKRREEKNRSDQSREEPPPPTPFSGCGGLNPVLVLEDDMELSEDNEGRCVVVRRQP